VKQVAVFVKRSGILMPCKVYPSATGCSWICANCEKIQIMSADLGVLSGFWCCPCGVEVELIVDGQTINIQEMNALEQEGLRSALDEERPYTERDLQQDAIRTLKKKKVTDEDFLRECGISATAIEEEPC
jgi:hypothetical protein